VASDDRFYQLDFTHRPVLKGDIGSLLHIQGLVVGGSGAAAILLLPTVSQKMVADLEQQVDMHCLTVEEWSDWLQRSDQPEILVNGGLTKAFHRKVRYEISGSVQQKIWAADSFRCVYCQAAMGEVLLTIDHFIPLELGGLNKPSNYLTACRKCNKAKGSIHPQEWCDETLYLELVRYLAVRKEIR
jgi:hypothetical protein